MKQYYLLLAYWKFFLKNLLEPYLFYYVFILIFGILEGSEKILFHFLEPYHMFPFLCLSLSLLQRLQALSNTFDALFFITFMILLFIT